MPSSSVPVHELPGRSTPRDTPNPEATRVAVLSSTNNAQDSVQRSTAAAKNNLAQSAAPKTSCLVEKRRVSPISTTAPTSHKHPKVATPTAPTTTTMTTPVTSHISIGDENNSTKLSPRQRMPTAAVAAAAAVRVHMPAVGESRPSSPPRRPSLTRRRSATPCRPCAKAVGAASVGTSSQTSQPHAAALAIEASTATATPASTSRGTNFLPAPTSVVATVDGRRATSGPATVVVPRTPTSSMTSTSNLTPNVSVGMSSRGLSTAVQRNMNVTQLNSSLSTARRIPGHLGDSVNIPTSGSSLADLTPRLGGDSFLAAPSSPVGSSLIGTLFHQRQGVPATDSLTTPPASPVELADEEDSELVSLSALQSTTASRGPNGPSAPKRKRKLKFCDPPPTSSSSSSSSMSASTETNVDSNLDVQPKRKKKKKRKKSSFKRLLKQMKRPRRTDEQRRADAVARIKSSVGGGVFAKMERL